MFNMTENTGSVSFIFSSEMQLADRAVRICRNFMEELSVSNFSEFRLVLRELLINAIEHGNKNDTQKTVNCCIDHLGGTRFRIIVGDEGEGFDYRALAAELSDDPRQIRSRGYALIRSFADRLEFNDKGNWITVYIAVAQQTHFHVSEDQDWRIITPTGDITASNAEECRKILVELADQGHRKFRFDFSKVEDVDSVGLSLLIIFSKMLDKKGGEKRLEILNPRKSLENLLRMTRIDRIYRVVSEEQGAGIGG
ncbi:MAG: ATP-binding protein [Desulfobacterales bacterium]